MKPRTLSGLLAVLAALCLTGSLRAQARDSFAVRNEFYTLSFAPEKTAFTVTDLVNGREWVSAVSDFPARFVEGERSYQRLHLRFDHSAVPGGVRVNAGLDGREVFFEIDAGDGAFDTPKFLRRFPGAFKTNLENGHLFFCDRSAGSYIPQDDPKYAGNAMLVYGNVENLDMPMVGLVDEASGDGALLIVDTPADAEVFFGADAEGRIWPRIRWKPSLEDWSYPRQLRYVFFADSDYVEMTKYYRAYVEERRAVPDLRTKAKTIDGLANLAGAGVFWGDDPLYDFVREARALGGVRRAVLCKGYESLANEGSFDRLIEMGYIVAGYDQTFDILEEDGRVDFQRGRIERDSYYTRDREPRKGWKLPDGRQMYMRSSLRGLRALPEFVPAHLAATDSNGRFIDVHAALNLFENYHPEDRYGRRQDLRYRRDIFEYYREFNLILGAEHGNDWAIDFIDYWEGALGGPLWWEAEGKWQAGYLTAPKSASDYPDGYLQYSADLSRRAPIWQLAYQDVASTTWYWGDTPGFHFETKPELAAQKDVQALLYAGMPLMWRDHRGYGWDRNRDRLLETYHTPVHFQKRVFFEEMTKHRFLDDAGRVQRTDFESGAFVIANFGDAVVEHSHRGETYRLPRNGYLAVAEDLIQTRKLGPGGDPVVTCDASDFKWLQSANPYETGAIALAGSGSVMAFRNDKGFFSFRVKGEGEATIHLPAFEDFGSGKALILETLDEKAKVVDQAEKNAVDGKLRLPLQAEPVTYRVSFAE